MRRSCRRVYAVSRHEQSGQHDRRESAGASTQIRARASRRRSPAPHACSLAAELVAPPPSPTRAACQTPRCMSSRRPCARRYRQHTRQENDARKVLTAWSSYVRQADSPVPPRAPARTALYPTASQSSAALENMSAKAGELTESAHAAGCARGEHHRPHLPLRKTIIVLAWLGDARGRETQRRRVHGV